MNFIDRLALCNLDCDYHAQGDLKFSGHWLSGFTEILVPPIPESVLAPKTFVRVYFDGRIWVHQVGGINVGFRIATMEDWQEIQPQLRQACFALGLAFPKEF